MMRGQGTLSLSLEGIEHTCSGQPDLECVVESYAEETLRILFGGRDAVTHTDLAAIHDKRTDHVRNKGIRLRILILSILVMPHSKRTGEHVDGEVATCRIHRFGPFLFTGSVVQSQ